MFPPLGESQMDAILENQESRPYQISMHLQCFMSITWWGEVMAKCLSNVKATTIRTDAHKEMWAKTSIQSLANRIVTVKRKHLEIYRLSKAFCKRFRFFSGRQKKCWIAIYFWTHFKSAILLSGTHVFDTWSIKWLRVQPKFGYKTKKTIYLKELHPNPSTLKEQLWLYVHLLSYD